MSTLYTNLEVRKNLKIKAYSLWDTKQNGWVTFNSKTPYNPLGGKAALEKIVNDGGLMEKPDVIKLEVVD